MLGDWSIDAAEFVLYKGQKVVVEGVPVVAKQIAGFY